MDQTLNKNHTMETTKNIGKKETLLDVFKRNLLVLLTVLGVIVGLTVGFGVREANPSSDAIMWIGLPGEMYMRMLKMMILPLIISTVITGTASLNPKAQGRISIVSVTYIAISNTVPAIIGAIIVVIINPGADISRSNVEQEANEMVMQTQDIFADLIRNLFPDNLITAAFQQTITKYDVEKLVNVSNGGNVTLVKKYLGNTNGTNVLGLIICCTLFGVGTSSMGKQGKPFLNFFLSASEIILKILRWLIWFTPVGVASLIATVLTSTDSIAETFERLGMFIVAAMLGLLLLMYVVCPVTYLLVVRKNPCTFYINLVRPLIVTCAVASTAIAIPDTLYFMEKKNHIDKRISRFVVPFSSALNKAGSALYIAASCVFICQLQGVDVNASKVVIIIILTSLSTFAVPSVPSAGIVTIIILLTAMNIPSHAVSLLLTVEWFLDRCRTGGNLYGQNLCVAVVQKFANLQENKQDTDSLDISIEIGDDHETKRNIRVSQETDNLLNKQQAIVDRCRTGGNLYGQNLCVAVVQKFANLQENKQDSDSLDISIEIGDDHETKRNIRVSQETENLLNKQQAIV